jgi:putative phosphoesterase
VVVRIGLVADTHIPEAGPDLPAEAYDALARCDRILHCGDLHTIEVVDRLERLAPTLVSRGNGDDPRTRPPGVPEDPRVAMSFIIDVDRVRIGLTHDLEHAEYRSDKAVAALLTRHFGQRVDIAVCGHTHVPLVWGLADGTAIVNPGSPTLPYGYRGLIGTIGFIEVDDGRFEITVVDLATAKPQLRLAGPAPHPCTRGPRPTGGK